MESKHTRENYRVTMAGCSIKNASFDKGTVAYIHNGKEFLTDVCTVWKNGNHQEDLDNFNLVSEAFTVARETNMTPRELQKSHAELLEALKGAIIDVRIRCEEVGMEAPKYSTWARAEQAIKNATKP